MCSPRPGKCGMLCGNKSVGSGKLRLSILIMLPPGESPAVGGAKALAAYGGEGASIAQMYILHSLQGKSPNPDAACGR